MSRSRRQPVLVLERYWFLTSQGRKAEAAKELETLRAMGVTLRAMD